jgi:hypothetical protein
VAQLNLVVTTGRTEWLAGLDSARAGEQEPLAVP